MAPVPPNEQAEEALGSVAPTAGLDKRSRPRLRTLRSRLLGVLYWGVVLTLVGLNAWRIWKDRPAVEMRTIDGWIKAGRLDDAEQALRGRLERSRHQGDARMALARLLAKRENYLGCAQQLHEVPFWWPAKAEALFLEGQAYKQVDRAREAEAAWKTCIADDPFHPMLPRYYQGAARELIGFYILEGRLDEAREILWRAYDQATPSERPGVLAMRMRAELERIAHEEAVVKLRRYAAADPSDWEARRALALEEQWTRHEDAANRAIDACLKAHPDDLRVWRTYLEILYQRGDRDGVKAALTRLPSSADRDAEIWKFRGFASEWAGDQAGTSEAFRRAIDLNRHEPEYLYKLGMAEHRLGRHQEAEAHTRRSRQLRQAYTELHDAYYAYLETTARPDVGPDDQRAAAERIASSCEQLGMAREAAAWRQAFSGG